MFLDNSVEKRGEFERIQAPFLIFPTASKINQLPLNHKHIPQLFVIIHNIQDVVPARARDLHRPLGVPLSHDLAEIHGKLSASHGRRMWTNRREGTPPFSLYLPDFKRIINFRPG